MARSQRGDPTQSDSLSGNVYDRIRQSLLAGHIAPGEHLSEPGLATQYETSRTPVREALLRLESEGFLVRSTSGRMSVRRIEIDEVRQLYSARAVVEGFAARLACDRLRGSDLKSMEALAVVMRTQYLEKDLVGVVTTGEQFHRIIIQECGNEPLIEMLKLLNSRITRFRAVSTVLPAYEEARIGEHAQILEALIARDARKAEALMINHIESAAEMVVAHLKQRQD